MKTNYTAEECSPFKTEWREARVIKVVDGDTYDLDVDLGFDMHTVTRFRLLGVDTWEVRGEEKEKGLIAKDQVLALMPLGSKVRIRSHKGGTRGKYGRWLCEVLYPSLTDEDDWQDLGNRLLVEGHGVPYGS